MSKKYLLSRIIGPTLVLGILIGGLGVYTLSKYTSKAVPQNTKVNQNVEVEKNLYDGSNLTLSEMYASLQQAEGSDFDHRLLMYEIAIKQNESGMLLMAKSKSTQGSMVKYSDIQTNQNEAVVNMMYGWQKQWGFSHH